MLHRVGELEDEAGDGQDDVDEVGFFVALEVDPALGDFVGGDRGCGEMLLGGGLVGGFLLGGFLFCGGVEGFDVGVGGAGLVAVAVKAAAWGGGCGAAAAGGWRQRRWGKDQVGGRDVEEDLGLGGDDFDAEVFGGHGEGRVGVVGDADVGAGVAALVGDGDHDGEAWRGDDLIAAAVEGFVDTAGVGFATNDVVGQDGFLTVLGMLAATEKVAEPIVAARDSF